MPKIAEAWVDLGTKPGGFYKGLAQARQEVSRTSGAFDRFGSTAVRVFDRPHQLAKKLLNIFEGIARQTEEGKASVDGFDESVAQLMNHLFQMATGGVDVAQTFQIMSSMIRGLNKDTDEYAMTTMSVARQMLAFRKFLGEHAKWLGASGALFALDPAEIKAFQEQIDDLDKMMREKNNELAKKDVADAQKRVDAQKKATKQLVDAKRVEFFSLEDLWKEAQRRAADSEKDMGPVGANQRAENAAERKEKFQNDQRQRRQDFARRTGGALTPHEVLDEEKKRNTPRKFSEMTPEQQRGYIEGAKHEEIDRLKQSGNPKERKRGYEMEEAERKYKAQRAQDAPAAGSDEDFKARQARDEQLDAAAMKQTEILLKIHEESRKAREEAQKQHEQLMKKKFVGHFGP